MRKPVYVPFDSKIGYGVEPQEPTEENPANCLFSETWPGIHYPCIDVDLPMRVVPSSTYDHFHLYFDVPVEWDKYKALLQAMADAELASQAYVDFSIAQGGTTVRMPGVQKR